MGMYGKHVSQGPIMRKIDIMANDLSQRENFLAALRDPKQGYVDILAYFGPLTPGAELTPYELKALREYWFDPHWEDPKSECWWKDHQPIEPIIRQGLIKAIEVASEDPDSKQKRNLLIDSHWVCIGDQFEVTVTCSGDHVTRINLTPLIREYSPPKNPQKVPSWVIKRDRSYRAKGNETLLDIVDELGPEDKRGRVVTFRHKDDR
jgi:hypothetical protein